MTVLLQTLEEKDKCKRMNINAFGNHNTKMTPMHIACKLGHWQIVQLFLNTLIHEDVNQTVCLNVKNNVNDTPLHLACQNGHWKVVKLLLETLNYEDLDKRIDLKMRNDKNETALNVAWKNGHFKIVQMIAKNYIH